MMQSVAPSGVVELWITEERFQLGDALAAEFIEGIWEEPAAKALIGS